MSDVPDFAPPHHLGTRESRLANGRESAGGNTVAYGTDDGMVVTFYEEPEYMEYLSKQTGHPIFRMRIMTRILQPGNNKTVWIHATKGISYEMAVDPETGEYHTDWDIQEVCENGDVPEPSKYPNAWNRFLKKGISADTGVPIEQWGIVTRSYAEALKMQNIHTVEALANLTDQAAQSFMGAVKYRDLARAYLDERKSMAIVSQAQERASRAEEQLAAQARKIEDLTASVMALTAKLNVGGVPADPGVRSVHEAVAIAPQLKQMSTANAKKKHRIPDAADAA